MDALRPFICRFVDDTSDRTFSGYTDGQRRNGFACPYLPLDELRRVLDVLLERDDEQPHYTVIDDQHVRVHGRAGVATDFMMTAEVVPTTDGDRRLFNCGGVWTFEEHRASN